MMASITCLPLTQPQIGALAKITCGAESGTGIVVLCGPSGVGKTTVLEQLAAELQADEPGCVVRGVDDWIASEAFPSVVLADDAHMASESDLIRLVARCRDRRPTSCLVLSGQPRLITLLARDRRLEQATRLTAGLLPGDLEDSALLVQHHADGIVVDEAAVVAIHEIAGGVPADVLRLLDLARVVAGTVPDSRLSADTIEIIHRRLSPRAA